MFQNNNGSVPKKIAKRSMYTNIRRNIIAIIAIILTSILFTSMFTMGFGLVESIQRATMIMAGGDGHGSIKYVTDEEYETISRHPLIKEMAYCRMLCDSVDNESLIKRHTEFWYYDDIGLKFGFIELASGHKPVDKNEVIADTKTLELMGVPLKVGAPITLDLTIHGRKVKRDFILVGWWESDPRFNIGQIFASKAYVDEHLDELKNTYYKDFSLTGTVTGYIKFKNSLNIEKNMETVLTESGYSMDKNDPNFIETGINWSYMATGIKVGIGTVMGFLCAMILFTFAGYLIIYNIFQISILKDIHFYGLIKTIGTTKGQLRSIVRHQAILLSLIGIPLGLLVGFLIGKAFVPTLMEHSSYAGSRVFISTHPFIFVGATIFTFITVFISTYKPGKIAGKVSPMEAISYREIYQGNVKKFKKSKKGSKLKYMAVSNLGRNKKRTFLVILSLSLSIILANTVFTISQSVDVNKALKKFNDSDFLIGHADLFNSKYKGEESALSESFIEIVKKQEGFEEGGCLYGTGGSYKSKTSTQTMNKFENNTYSTDIYGLDAFPFSRLKLIDGEIDNEKLLTGDYILEGIEVDDNGNPLMDSFNHKVGDEITLKHGNNSHKMTILGHVVANLNTNTDMRWSGSAFYLPTDVFKKLTGIEYAMSYSFDVFDDQESNMEIFLKQYTDTVEPTMNYTSKFTTLSALEEISNTAILIGGTLSLIIGLIGILNFINTILTSILVRRREFAIMQSIGMTRKQLKIMLCYEGSYYAIFTGIVSIIFSICSSLMIIRPLSENIWFMSFKFVFWPLVIILPILIVLSLLIPVIVYCSLDGQTLVEKLQE